MAINNIPNLFQPRVTGLDSTPNLFNIDQAQVQQAIDQKKINDGLAEQEQRKRADRSMKLQQFADTMRMVNANKSGNYGASKIFSDRIAQRKALAEQKQKEALLKTQQDEFVKNNPQYKNAIQLNTLFPGVNLPTTKNTETERATTRLVELNNKPNLSDQEKTELNVLKTKLYGQQKVVPFLDSDGNPINQVITNWDINDRPDLITELNKQGFVTVGSGPALGFSASKAPSEVISDRWENTTNTLTLVNQLGKVLSEGVDSATIPGKIADVLNTGIYQFKSATKLLQIQQANPTGFAENIEYIKDNHGGLLDKISADRGKAASTVMRLAYSLAKQQDPGGKLSDRDIDSAVEIIGGSGSNVKKRLEVLNALNKSLINEYNTFLNTQELLYGKNKTVKETIKNFKTLPKFEYYSDSDNAQTAESILEELERDGLL